MAGEEGLLPRSNFRDPRVKQQQRRDPTEEYHGEEDDNEPPGCQEELRCVEHVERHPSANIDETPAVQHEVNDRGEDLVLRLCVEVPVPANGSACDGFPSVNIEYRCVQRERTGSESS